MVASGTLGAPPSSCSSAFAPCHRPTWERMVRHLFILALGDDLCQGIFGDLGASRPPSGLASLPQNLAPQALLRRAFWDAFYPGRQEGRR
jgi:hypothetical protein